MKKFLLFLVLVIVLGGAYLLMKGKPPTSQSMTDTQNEATPSGATGSSASLSPTASSGAMMEGVVAKEFTLDATEFSFSLKEIKVKTGDTVKVTLTSSGTMPHDWVVDEFNAQTKTIPNGKTDTVTFVADKAGTFEYYCSIGNHRKMGMVGKLIVQ